VAALINWANESRELTLDLPDIGLQHAKIVKNIWAKETLSNVRTTYSAAVDAHGVMLLELEDATEAGLYPSSLFATSKG
jgi:alpha-galactosidase